MSALTTDSTLATRHRVAMLALAALAALTLAACGGGGYGSDNPPAASETPSASDTAGDTAGATGTTVAVSGIEYGFVVPDPPTTAGTYTFVLSNDGNMAHDMVLEGVDGASTASIGPGDTAEFTVTLEAGDYTLYCSLGNHRAQGMEVSFTIS